MGNNFSKLLSATESVPTTLPVGTKHKKDSAEKKNIEMDKQAHLLREKFHHRHGAHLSFQEGTTAVSPAYFLVLQDAALKGLSEVSPASFLAHRDEKCEPCHDKTVTQIDG